MYTVHAIQATLFKIERNLTKSVKLIRRHAFSCKKSGGPDSFRNAKQMKQNIIPIKS